MGDPVNIHCTRCQKEIDTDIESYYYHQQSMMNGCKVCLRELELYRNDLMQYWRLIMPKKEDEYECCAYCEE